MKFNNAFRQSTARIKILEEKQRLLERKPFVLIALLLLVSFYNIIDMHKNYYIRNDNNNNIIIMNASFTNNENNDYNSRNLQEYRYTIDNNDIDNENDDNDLQQKENIVDIMSVGSVLKESYQDGQERTFGSHISIRKFFRITEISDTDRQCYLDISLEQLNNIITFCNNTRQIIWGGTQTLISSRFRTFLFQPKLHAGWMCAQKRPIDGLHYVLQQYKDNIMPLPKYLFIIDDDTYINMDLLMETLYNKFHYNTPYLIAGCNFDWLEPAIPFPYGGFGSFITRAALQNMLKPIYCNISKEHKKEYNNDPFNQLACWRLKLNALGEKEFFIDGMSVSDLMYEYAAKQPFGQVNNWTAGYCLHSDHALSYFLNFYHIAVPNDILYDNDIFTLSDTLRSKYKYTHLSNIRGDGRIGECNNELNLCKSDNLVCHYINPKQMDELYLQQAQTTTTTTTQKQ